MEASRTVELGDGVRRGGVRQNILGLLPADILAGCPLSNVVETFEWASGIELLVVVSTFDVIVAGLYIVSWA